MKARLGVFNFHVARMAIRDQVIEFIGRLPIAAEITEANFMATTYLTHKERK